jgi:NADPH:quinone reductase-like Zn-dependent oxidoreductase
MPSMKAVRIHAYGGPETLTYEDVARPAPGPKEVLIRNHAASINPVDWKIRAGYLKEYVPISLPCILGLDLSGVVEGVGLDVKGFKAGDEVYAMTDMGRDGTYAEYTVVDETVLAAKPKSQDHVHAAAIPLAGLTAWHGLFEFGNLKSGQKVLIHGATGGVGSFAVQLAKWKGAQVFGTASTRNLSLLKDLGADQAIDYTAAAFEKSVSDVDLVIDLVGGDTQQRSWAVLKKGGVLASTVMEPKPPNPALMGKYIANRPNAQGLRELAKLADAGKLRAIVETALPLREARKGHETSETGHARGKIVLRMA